MKLKVETFLDPAKDPQLKKIADWRAADRYPAVDFHRVTADNSAGRCADSGRTIRFARAPSAIADRQGRSRRASAATRSSSSGCRGQDGQDPAAGTTCAQTSAPTVRRSRTASPPAPQVYYLVTDRGFGERGIRTMRVFGPRDAEFK